MKFKALTFVAVFLAMCTLVQAAALEGVVVDADLGTPLEGANVVVAGTTLGTATDARGGFSLSGLPQGKVTIEVTYLGYAVYTKTLNVSETKSTYLAVKLHPSAVGVGAVTVTARRSASETAPVPTNVIGEDMIETRNVARMEEAFSQQSGVALSATGPGSTRPVIRGMYESQVLVLWDGVPMLDLRPGGDHVLLIEPEQLNRVEIVRGPGSVLYGSDAVGGVVNFVTSGYNPFDGKSLGVSAGASGGYSSLGNLMRGNAGVTLG
ncbi:TonB-dependent receptor plug domain-containing protein, partial [candidate division WOR-3 bacterium]|nr:TonB-dependent receptor plug domain-containing protein [candidate division WOR-3 bacterium]